MDHNRTLPVALSVLAALHAACSSPDSERASEIGYDGSASGLKGQNVQAALDELAAAQGQADAGIPQGAEKRLGDLESAVSGLQSDMGSVKTHLQVLDEAISSVSPVQAAVVAFDDSTTAIGASTAQEAFEQLFSLIAAQKSLIEEQATKLEEQTGQIASLETKLTQATALLQEQLASPRPCPAGTIEAGPLTCVEPGLRSANNHVAAAAICYEVGLRLCATSELIAICGWNPAGLLDLVGKVPEWSGDAVGRLSDAFDTALEVEVLAFGGGGGCSYGESASVTLMGQDTKTTAFPYRCCSSR